MIMGEISYFGIGGNICGNRIQEEILAQLWGNKE
jgi:hypothetical protein